MMTDAKTGPANDWAANFRTLCRIWGIPAFLMVAGSFAELHPRAAIWTVALLWMGTACLINSRRCGRVHCRFTGPFYLVMVIPVLLLGLEVFSLGSNGWWIVGAIILFGGKIIWWATETVWGKYFLPGY